MGVRDKLDFLGVNYYFLMFLRLSPLNMKGPEYLGGSHRSAALRKPAGRSTRRIRRRAAGSRALSGSPLSSPEKGAAETDDLQDRLHEGTIFVSSSGWCGEDRSPGIFLVVLMDKLHCGRLRPRFGLYRVDFGRWNARPPPPRRFARWVKRGRALEGTGSSR